jgi:glutathione synthase
MRVLFVMDALDSINPKKDTTLLLMLAAQAAGHSVYEAGLSDLYLRDGTAWGECRAVRVFDDPQHWFEAEPRQTLPLGGFDAIVMRKDPPFDLEFIQATYTLERAEAAGAKVFNRPQSLRDCNEKTFIQWFSPCCAPTLISRNLAHLRAFHAEQGEVIFKPLDGMGGKGIFKVNADGQNLGSVLETLTQNGQHSIMAQHYLPAITAGDKRILVVHGQPLPYVLARVPQGSEIRGNLAAGGKGVVQPLSERDAWIAAQVGPELLRRGLLFVGLDVIGDYLTEINVTSPTCAREIFQATGVNAADLFWQGFSQGL